MIAVRAAGPGFNSSGPERGRSISKAPAPAWVLRETAVVRVSGAQASGAGPWMATVKGAPVLKKPMVAFVACGGLLESKRKL